MMLNNIVESELDYFRPIMEKARQATPENREQWRHETVQQRRQRIATEVYDMVGGEVRYGPFKGLQMVGDTWWGNLDQGSQCLGLYEKEILDFIEGIEPDQFDSFIDIGAADGYYAVGMLLSGKTGKTICFEQSEKGREVIQSNWEANGSVGEMLILGEANAQSMAELSASDLDNALVLIDIEGFEFELLTDPLLQALSSCTIIIEVHNWVEDFLARYESFLRDASHYFQMEALAPAARNADQCEELRGFSDDNRLLLASEGRPCLMRFLKLSPL